MKWNKARLAEKVKECDGENGEREGFHDWGEPLREGREGGRKRRKGRERKTERDIEKATEGTC